MNHVLMVVTPYKLKTSFITQVVEANIFSTDSLKPHFEGQDAVMSCLGFTPSLFSGITGYTESMTATLDAMREVKVNRIITMTSWYTERKCSSSVKIFDYNHILKVCTFKILMQCCVTMSNM